MCGFWMCRFLNTLLTFNIGVSWLVFQHRDAEKTRRALSLFRKRFFFTFFNLKTCKWRDIGIFDNMTKGATKLEREEQIPALQDDDWDYRSEAEIEGIKAGLKDPEGGRMHSHEDVMAHIDKKLNSMR